MNWLVDADVKPPEFVTGVEASGGEESIINVRGQLYKAHKFTSSGTLNVTSGGTAEVLVVGSGGAGGSVNFFRENSGATANFGAFKDARMGGGGGGGVIETSVQLTPQNYTATVSPVGGSVSFVSLDQPYDIVDPAPNRFFGTNVDVSAESGGFARFANFRVDDSVFVDASAELQAASTGGGSCVNSRFISGNFIITGGGYAQASQQNITGQGNVGATQADAPPIQEFRAPLVAFSGGGGGAGGRGILGGASSSANGGAGYISSITGEPVLYGGGGGGGSISNLPGIGQGGGGNGAFVINPEANLSLQVFEPPTAGQNGTGGGGGGSSLSVVDLSATSDVIDKLIGAPGGTGVVIVRYPIGG